ncbi:MAG: hypothetical protein R2940_02535 [Syntrophotaleaceae bacterium]
MKVLDFCGSVRQQGINFIQQRGIVEWQQLGKGRFELGEPVQEIANPPGLIWCRLTPQPSFSRKTALIACSNCPVMGHRLQSGVVAGFDDIEVLVFEMAVPTLGQPQGRISFIQDRVYRRIPF